ncbi:3165_t:CDS:2 [Dentiscutata erythropus]|uniref:3165_t:CDS:1 n=1 Tax=Dentiscutata erythropus TaxID=1348616 RepID=A0A9N9NM45_9GLOM|nr:3165_t:CDS:2 [Dentiscutata erythropus]
MDEGVMFFIKNPKEYKISVSHRGNKSSTKKDLFPAKQKSHLLLILTTNHKPPATSTIANWIKEIIMEASPNLRAKDARALAAFYTQISGTDLSTILTGPATELTNNFTKKELR